MYKKYLKYKSKYMNLKNSIAPCELHEMTVKEPYFTFIKME